jgi:hypothetical protein
MPVCGRYHEAWENLPFGARRQATFHGLHSAILVSADTVNHDLKRLLVYM